MARMKQALVKKSTAATHPAALAPVKKEAPTRKDVMKMITARHPASCRSLQATKH